MLYRLKESPARHIPFARVIPDLTVNRLCEQEFTVRRNIGLRRLVASISGFILCLSVGSVVALELGPIEVKSHLNEPLKAVFPMQKLGDNNLEDIRISLADRKAYRTFGLPRTSFLSSLKFTLVEGENERHFVHVTSRQRVMEPIMEVLVKVTQKNNSLTRLYTLMVDPVNVSSLKLNTRPPLPEPDVLQTDKPVADENRVALDNSKVERIEVRNKSISLIAQESVLHEKYSVYQIMRAFYRLNPQAFNKGNINFIKSGSILIVPAEESVAEVPRLAAIKFVKSVSRNYPFQEPAELNQMHQGVSNPSSESPEKQLNVEGDVIIDESAPAVLFEEIKISPGVQHDLISWRDMTEEFKVLNSQLQSHNRAIQLQNDVMQKMDARMDKKNEDIMQLVRRIDVLESSLQSINPGQVSDVGGVQNVLINQSRIIEDQQGQIADINDQLSKKEKDISSITGRLQAIEKQNQLITASIQNVQQQAIMGDAEEIIITDANGSDSSFKNLIKSHKLWIFLGLAVVLFIVVARELTRKRLDPTPRAKNNVLTRPKQKHVLTPSAQETNMTAEVIQRKKSDSKINTDTVGDVHTELDILIAYEQFDEALQLVHSAREKLPDDHWLDIKEIEILGYTKNFDLFYSMLAEHEEALSREFPLAWKNVMKLNRKLNQEFQKSAIS